MKDCSQLGKNATINNKEKILILFIYLISLEIPDFNALFYFLYYECI